MRGAGGARAPGAAAGDVRAPLGHLMNLGFALRNASDIDQVAGSVLSSLNALPGVSRVGFALSEGGGRRLRFVSAESADDPRVDLAWCHIDAYDDVPLTTVVRTGEPLMGDLDAIGTRFPGVVDRQRDAGTCAIGTWPLPGDEGPLGGLVVFFDQPQTFGAHQRRLLEATARRTAEAVRRVRADAVGVAGADPVTDDVADGQRAGMVLASDPSAPGAARRFLRGLLEEWEIDGDAVDTAQLCLSELVTNAVVHARAGSELSVHLAEGVLTVVVRDRGGPGAKGDSASYADVPEDEDALAVFGRGLTLVDALADRWGSSHDEAGTTAWFSLDTPTRTGHFERRSGA